MDGPIPGGVRRAARVIEGLLPTRTRIWLENYRAARRVGRGVSSFDRARLIHTYTECLRRLLREETPAQLGDYLEFGVFHGTTVSCMHAARVAMGLQHVRLIGFDSFEGLPPGAAEETDGFWAAGQFRSSLELTRKNLERWGVPAEDVTLVKGWFRDTATEATRVRLGIRSASVIMIDCDLYASTVDALAFCAPLIDRQAIIVFDDWHAGDLADKNLGERRAFDEFLAAHPDLRADEIHGLNYKEKRDPVLFHVRRAQRG